MGNKENKMFCFQCQETAGCSGCTVSGVCGKEPDVAAMQDLLVYVTKGISAVTTQLRSEGKEIDDKYISAEAKWIILIILSVVDLFVIYQLSKLEEDQEENNFKNKIARDA